jgi:hypothetical protein
MAGGYAAKVLGSADRALNAPAFPIAALVTEVP